MELFGCANVFLSEDKKGRVEKEGAMTLRFQEVEIENVNQYPEPVVGSLRAALRQGAPAVPDPKRSNFFEVAAEDQRFYIDVPGDGHKVILLSAWHDKN